jgi:23S rRNA pseudouridine1911/1915/1917 synthase
VPRDRDGAGPGSLAARTFRAGLDQANRPLAKAVGEWLPGKNREQIAALIRGRHVMLNGNLCTDPGRRLAVGDFVKLLAQPAARAPVAGDIVVRYADAHLAVVEKPAGITSVREKPAARGAAGRVQRQATLDELVPRALEGKRGSPHGRSRGHSPSVYPVHRLDRETSGLIIFARTVMARDRLANMLKRHQIERIYQGIVVGNLEARTMESHLVTDRGDGRRGSSQKPGEGLRAVTHVRPLQRAPGYTLVECRLETGRTHQIRIHLGEAGHPICGDRLYRKPLGGRIIPDRSGARRLALHAVELRLAHPITGRELTVRSEFSRELRELWTRLCAEEERP